MVLFRLARLQTAHVYVLYTRIRPYTRTLRTDTARVMPALTLYVEAWPLELCAYSLLC